MRRNRIIFWLGEASPHQSGYLRALADLLPQKAIIGVFQQGLQTERLALGWRTPDLGRMEVVMSPDQKTINEIALREPENTVHIFGGMRLTMVKHALRICARTAALIGMASEARDWRGSLGKLRLLHSYFVERPYRNRVDFVLAIGHSGVQWYEVCGYPSHRIFPWGYVVERPSNDNTAQKRRLPAHVVISYVGRCVRGKGIDTLLSALSALRAPAWCLQVVGDGPQRKRLEALARKLALAEQVRFLGIRQNTEVWRILDQTDLFVFPSRIDGWGAVVNEALMSGTPVLCSDYCGAADLIRANGFGETFRAGSVDELARVLHRWISNGPLTDARRSEIREWSKCIEGEAAARYLIEIIEHIDEGAEKPLAPWLQKRSTARSLILQ